MQSNRKQKIGYLIVFIILIGFLVFAVLSSRDSKTTPPSGTTQIRESARDDKPSTSDARPSTPPEEDATSSSAPAPSPTPSSAATNSGNQLVNSGPGETVTLFVATVLAGTAVAHVRQRRTAFK